MAPVARGFRRRGRCSSPTDRALERRGRFVRRRGSQVRGGERATVVDPRPRAALRRCTRQGAPRIVAGLLSKRCEMPCCEARRLEIGGRSVSARGCNTARTRLQGLQFAPADTGEWILASGRFHFDPGRDERRRQPIHPFAVRAALRCSSSSKRWRERLTALPLSHRIPQREHTFVQPSGRVGMRLPQKPVRLALFVCCASFESPLQRSEDSAASCRARERTAQPRSCS
jgi:hypothetical protein